MPMKQGAARRGATEPRDLAGRSRREIAWDELPVGQLSEARRRVVGLSWRERMKQEHLAVGAFAMLAQELAEDGCEGEILGLIARAASDEVRHAEICRRMAVALLGEAEVPARYRGLPKIPRHEGRDASTRALLHVVEMCCLSETLTGVYFAEMIARATSPVARAAVESLLADEIDHGRAGWAYLAWRAAGVGTLGLAEALPSLVGRAIGEALDHAERAGAPDDAGMEAFGYLGSVAAAKTIRRALGEVILPGFDHLGIDTTQTKALVHERGWS